MQTAPPISRTGSQDAQRWARRLCAAMAVLWLGWGLVMVPHYGIAIDTPALFYGGERTVYWWHHHREPEALDLKGAEPKDLHAVYGRQPAGEDPLHYPSFPGTVAAIVGGWLQSFTRHYPDWEAREVGLLLLHVFGFYLFGRYACRLIGPLAGSAALVALGLYPTVIGVAINNPKDWPSALYYAVGLLAAGVALIEDRPAQLLMAGVFFGLSLSSKLNGAFGIITLILWSPVAWLTLYWHRQRVTVAMASAWLLVPQLALGVFILLWPWLYSQGLPTFFHNLAEYLAFLTSYGIGARNSWSNYPLRCLVGYTPPLLLLLSAMGMGLGWRGGRRAFAAWTLLISWLAIVMLRMAAPHSNFYDGNRHFLEYIPALAGLAGLGLREALAELRRLGLERPRAIAAGAMVGLALADLAIPIATYHPYEIAYFSPLVGGLGGAQRRRLLFEPPPHDFRTSLVEGDYWYGATPDMVRDLQLVLKPGQKVALCGPWAYQVDAAFQPGRPPPYGDVATADFVLQSYRGCAERDALANIRPVLFSERRGGGLIYRIFGPRYAAVP